MIPPFMIGRRQLILSGVVAAASACAGSSKHLVTPNKPVLRGTVPPTALAQARVAAAPVAPGPEPRIVQEALAALDRHDRMVVHRDRIAIVDFSVPSSKPRMQVLNVGSGKMTQFLVAHGSGSDPDHTGYLQRFSNIPDSNASSQGAFVTADYYVGKHGRSQRLLGLDPTNNNALERAIVVHGAWYANADMIPVHGKLGRSQGCFAVGETELATLFDQLGPGRMIYSAKA